MKLRTIVISVAVLAVLAAIVAFIRRPAPPSADTRLGQPVADRATIEQASRLRVSDQGKTVALARDDSGTWRVTTYHDFPADFSKLSRLTDELATAKIQRLVTSNPNRIARLEFKDAKIELLDASDKNLLALTLGKHADAGGRFVRFGDEQKAYLTNLSTWLDTESKNWASTTLVDLKTDDIAKLELSFPAGDSTPSLAFSRTKKDDPWTSEQTPANHTIAIEKINSTLSTLTSLRFSDTLAPDDPKVAEARPHARTIKLTTFDGKTVSITLARKPEEKKLKPPTPSADGTSGPAALGSISDLAKKDGTASDENKADQAKLLEPEFETIPAGPVFVTVTHSDASAPINELMKKRAFQVYEYIYTGLPQASADFFAAAPAPEAPATETTPAETSSAETKE